MGRVLVLPGRNADGELRQLVPFGGIGGVDSFGNSLTGFAWAGDVLWHMALPLANLVILNFAGYVLLMRNSLLEVLGEDFVTVARAKGLKERTVMYKHAARNAMLPVTTVTAIAMATVISGGVLTETIFSWPGMGFYFVARTLGQDFPAVQGAFFILALHPYWQADPSSFLFGAGSPIPSRVAMRVIPRATDPRADRLYAASGNKLLALNPAAGGSKGWTAPDQTASFTTAAPITAGPVAVNFGSKTNPSYLDFVVYIGTSDGTFYALNDSAVEFDGDTALPGGSNVATRSLTGSVTSIAVWSEPTDDPPFPGTPARNPGESVFVGTSDGYLYAFAASDLSPMWNRSFGAGVTVRMAAAPMNPPTNPSYSPALTEDGQRLFVNAGDWQSFYALNGTLAWTGFPVSTPWTSAPVVSLPSTLADGSFGELVYAASDDGWLFAPKVATGCPYEPWATSPASQVHPTLPLRTIPVMQTVSQRDPGPLSAPFLDSTTVYVTSSSGILYSIARDAVGTLSAGTVKWRFVDKVLQERGFQFTAPPVLAIAQRIIFGVGVDSKGTPDPSDDQGILYSLSEVGDLLWRKDFDGPLDASPSIWTTQVGSQLNIPNVWLGTGKGWVYAISSTGKYLAPLPPGTYPSGNQYLWGTDLQGRDIFSQFIWGSRIALIVGFSVALLTVGIGLVVGLVAGYLGRKTDIVLMRFTDVILVLPLLP